MHCCWLNWLSRKKTGLLWQWNKKWSQLVGPRATSATNWTSKAAWMVKAVTEDCTKSAASDPMELNETKQLSWFEAERISAADVMHRRLLEQVQCFCATVHNIGDRMEGKFAEESL